MKYPEFLKDNGTIGFVAPSFGCATEPYRSAFDNALKTFGEMGYKIELGPNCYEGVGVGISNTPEKCAKELVDYYTKESNDILISCGGGELMCETMSEIDFDVLKEAKPKWYAGYSDNTNMDFLLTTILDTASIYGPCAAAFGQEPWHESLHDMMAVLRGEKTTVHSYDMWEIKGLKDEEHPLLPYNCTEATTIKAWDNGYTDNTKMSGRLIGGCLDCLSMICGTRFDKVSEFIEKYKEDGFIWVIESCMLDTFSMRRVMWQLYEAGWFKYCKGMIVGRPDRYGLVEMGLDQYEAMLVTAKKLGVPMIMDADVGHRPPAMPIVLGAYADAQFENGKLEIAMKYI